MSKNSYWASNGNQQEIANKLKDLTPDYGESDTPVIEIFRLLQNAYYDLFNNGGGNECRWEFVPKIKDQLKLIDADTTLKRNVLQSAREFRNCMTKTGCWPKESAKEKVYDHAEKAIDDICLLFSSIT